jgi:hypothetical protein
MSTLFTNVIANIFLETRLSGVVISQNDLSLKEKEPQQRVLLMFPPLRFLGFAGGV